MEIKVATEEPRDLDQHQQPLLKQRKGIEQQTPIQKAISQTFKSTAYLANLLPTGTVLVFQLLSPVLTNQGQCNRVGRNMTGSLLGLCGLSCFLTCFTDSFRDGNGKVCYGLATYQGLWVIDGSATIAPELTKRYRLKFIDFLHAFLSILVFSAIALFDQNVVKCFYPAPSEETKELLISLPIAMGVICSMVSVGFPTKRHGIGFPLSSH